MIDPIPVYQVGALALANVAANVRPPTACILVSHLRSTSLTFDQALTMAQRIGTSIMIITDNFVFLFANLTEAASYHIKVDTS